MTKAKLPDTLLDGDELAAKCFPGKQGRTMRKWAIAGLIPCYRVNKKTVLFSPDEVMAALSKRRESSFSELQQEGAR
jgi:hypothetical protein